MSESIAEIVTQVRQQVAAVHALDLFGDHRGSADVADRLIEDLRRRAAHQLVHVIEVLADFSPLVLAQVAVQLADPQAREDAARMVNSATVDIYGTESEPTP